LNDELERDPAEPIRPTEHELEEIRELRQLFSASESLRLLDDFAKWLFASAAVVGSVGAGFGSRTLTDLDAWGKTLFLAALVAVAVTLILAALARLPARRSVNRHDLAGMREDFAKVTSRRYGFLVTGVVLFALALVLATLSVVVD
jgi:hypothetical protein